MTSPLDMKDQARREFDSWAQVYDQSILQRLIFEPSYTAFLEWTHHWYGDDSTARTLLDVGCGTGTLAAKIEGASFPFRVIALDYAQGMCLQADRKARAAGCADRVHFINGDSEHLPFPDGAVDVITCSNSFHHYPHQQAVIAEMMRVLKPGGRLMLIDGFRDNMIGWFVFDVCVATVEKAVFHAPWSTVRNYFEQAGFVEITQHKYNVFAPILLTIGRKSPAATGAEAGRN